MSQFNIMVANQPQNINIFLRSSLLSINSGFNGFGALKSYCIPEQTLVPAKCKQLLNHFHVL